MTEHLPTCRLRLGFQSADAPAARASLRYSTFAESIVESLAECLERGVLPLAPMSVVDETLEDGESAVRTHRLRIEELQNQERNVLGAITSGNVSEHLLSELDRQFIRIRDALLAEESLFNEATLDLDRLLAARGEEQRKRRIETAAVFVSELGNPHSTLAREFFARCVSNLDFRLEVTHARERILHWTGCINFSSEAGTIQVPFAGHQLQDRREGAGDEWIIERLLSGHPLGTDSASRQFQAGILDKVWPSKILPRLHLQPHESWMLHVGDPLLLKCYLALYSSHPDRQSWADLEDEIRREHGEPDRFQMLLKRTHKGFEGLKRPKWAQRRPLWETQCLIKIAQGHSLERSEILKPYPAERRGVAEPWNKIADQFRPSPCRTCASTSRIRLMIDEPCGYVCLNCRSDGAGIRWPERIDRFAAYPELWTQAGFALLLPSPLMPPRATKRRYSRRRDRLAGLPMDAIDTIITAYQEGQNLSNIIKQHDLKDAHDIYRILDDRGIPRRRLQKPQRRRAS